jgi:hypothetical protein
MLKWILTGLLPLLTGVCGHAAGLQHNIVTGTENATYFRIGSDLATHVAPEAGIELRVLPSKGSVENIKRLRDEPGTKLALIQVDVYEAYKDLAASGNREALRIIAPLRVVLPLYSSELHMVVRADSPLRSVSEIRDQRINIGPLGSGNAMAAATLYRMMFNSLMAEDKVSTMSNEDALIALVKDKSVDVVIVAAGQPAALFLGMEPGAEKYFRLLKLDDTPATTAALDTYTKSTIRASSYPAWLSEDHPALAVKALLVTYDYNLPETRSALARFAKSLCKNFGTLQSQGHAKWREVSLSLPPLGPGWRYYPPTEEQLRRCTSRGTSVTVSKPMKRPYSSCALRDQVLGLCAEP